MASRRCADWRFPTEKQARSEETARRMQATAVPPGDIGIPTTEQLQQVSPPAGPGDPMPEAYWASILAEPGTRTRPGVPIQNRRLSEIPRHVLRVGCRRCDRTIEIQTTDAQKLYGTHAVWKDVGRRLLDDSCQQRTGSHEDDGCWPSYDTP